MLEAHTVALQMTCQEFPATTAYSETGRDNTTKMQQQQQRKQHKTTCEQRIKNKHKIQ